MCAVTLRLPGLVVIEPAVHGDERGFFVRDLPAASGTSGGHPRRASASCRTTTRAPRAGSCAGMHFQVGDGVAKLVRCARGRILDVAVDLRRGLADLRAVGGGRARRREHARAVRAGRLRPRLLRAQRDGRRALQADRLLRRRASNAGSPGTTRRSAIDWPLPADELIVSERDAAAPRLRGDRRRTAVSVASLARCSALQRLRERTNGYTVTPAPVRDAWRTSRWWR